MGARRRVVEGAIRAQAYFILQDEYANAFNLSWTRPSLLAKVDRSLGERVDAPPSEAKSRQQRVRCDGPEVFGPGSRNRGARQQSLAASGGTHMQWSGRRMRPVLCHLGPGVHALRAHGAWRAFAVGRAQGGVAGSGRATLSWTRWGTFSTCCGTGEWAAVALVGRTQRLTPWLAGVRFGLLAARVPPTPPSPLHRPSPNAPTSPRPHLAYRPPPKAHVRRARGALPHPVSTLSHPPCPCCARATHQFAAGSSRQACGRPSSCWARRWCTTPPSRCCAR